MHIIKRAMVWLLVQVDVISYFKIRISKVPCPTLPFSADEQSRWRSLRMVIPFSALPQIRTNPISMHHITNTTYAILLGDIRYLSGDSHRLSKTDRSFLPFICLFFLQKVIFLTVNFRLNNDKPLKSIIPGKCNGFVIRTNMREVFCHFTVGVLQ